MKNDKNIHGFKVPEDYFEEFDTRLFTKVASDKLPKESGFQVPEAYFDGLEEAVFERLTASEKPAAVIPLFRRNEFKYITGIAACAAILLSLFLFNNNDRDNEYAIDMVNLEAYIEEGNLELDSYEIASYLNDEQLSELNFIDEIYSEDNMENYLLENLDDTTLLIE